MSKRKSEQQGEEREVKNCLVQKEQEEISVDSYILIFLDEKEEKYYVAPPENHVDKIKKQVNLLMREIAKDRKVSVLDLQNKNKTNYDNEDRFLEDIRHNLFEQLFPQELEGYSREMQSNPYWIEHHTGFHPLYWHKITKGIKANVVCLNSEQDKLNQGAQYVALQTVGLEEYGIFGFANHFTLTGDDLKEDNLIIAKKVHQPFFQSFSALFEYEDRDDDIDRMTLEEAVECQECEEVPEETDDTYGNVGYGSWFNALFIADEVKKEGLQLRIETEKFNNLADDEQYDVCIWLVPIVKTVSRFEM